MAVKKGLKVILSGGGTGGHIYPAIAIANEIKARDPYAEFLFVGAKDRMEMSKVPEAGYKIEGLWISGLQRRLTLDNLAFPIKLISSLLKAIKTIKSFKPDVVVGTGGYASAPTLKAAQLLGVPYIIQEQNSYAGVTNKWVSKGAQKICVAYDNMERFFDKNKIVKTGNPVRGELLNLPTDINKEGKKLLILGGSLGAKAINELIETNLHFFEQLGIQVNWQCGKFYYDKYKKYDSKNVKVRPFINNMSEAYSSADIIISRAGASSVSELCLVGKAVIFIPSPNVAEDHQTKNAMAIANNDGAIFIAEKDLSQKFRPEFNALVTNQQRMLQLGQNIKKMAKPNATKDIVNIIFSII